MYASKQENLCGASVTYIFEIICDVNIFKKTDANAPFHQYFPAHLNFSFPQAAIYTKCGEKLIQKTISTNDMIISHIFECPAADTQLRSLSQDVSTGNLK